MGNNDFTTSKERLLNMLNSQKMSKEDYILLSNAKESSGMGGAKLWTVFVLVIAISFSVMGYM